MAKIQFSQKVCFLRLFIFGLLTILFVCNSKKIERMS